MVTLVSIRLNTNEQVAWPMEYFPSYPSEEPNENTNPQVRGGGGGGTGRAGPSQLTLAFDENAEGVESPSSNTDSSSSLDGAQASQSSGT